jgi:hypothetical protein
MSEQFQPYFESVRATYARWWQLYTLTDAAGKEAAGAAAPTFDFGLMVERREEREKREEGREKGEGMCCWWAVLGRGNRRRWRG